MLYKIYVDGVVVYKTYTEGEVPYLVSLLDYVDRIDTIAGDVTLINLLTHVED